MKEIRSLKDTLKEIKMDKLPDYEILNKFINLSNHYETIVTNFRNGTKPNLIEGASKIDALFNKADFLKYLRAVPYDDKFIVDMMIKYFTHCKF